MPDTLIRYSPVEHFDDVLLGEDIAGGLHDQLDAITVLAPQLFQGRIEHGLANRIEKDFPSGDNDAAPLFAEVPVLIRVGKVQIGHPAGEVVDDTRYIILRLANRALQLLSVIRMESILIAMFAGAMAHPAQDEVNRFHGASSQPV